MEVALTAQQRADLEAAVSAEHDVRRWRRYQAVLLLADDEAPVAVAHRLRCSRASVYGWVARWRAQGVAGLHEGDHGGGKPKLDARGETVLMAVLATDPQSCGHQATGWTVPLLRTELAAAGYAVADRTLRRALHRLGYRWKRPRYVLGRPDPEYEAKKGG
jgi:transposase